VRVHRHSDEIHGHVHSLRSYVIVQKPAATFFAENLQVFDHLVGSSAQTAAQAGPSVHLGEVDHTRYQHPPTAAAFVDVAAVAAAARRRMRILG
jgi:hypothetical protein